MRPGAADVDASIFGHPILTAAYFEFYKYFLEGTGNGGLATGFGTSLASPVADRFWLGRTDSPTVQKADVQKTLTGVHGKLLSRQSLLTFHDQGREGIDRVEKTYREIEATVLRGTDRQNQPAAVLHPVRRGVGFGVLRQVVRLALRDAVPSVQRPLRPHVVHHRFPAVARGSRGGGRDRPTGGEFRRPAALGDSRQPSRLPHQGPVPVAGRDRADAHHVGTAAGAYDYHSITPDGASVLLQGVATEVGHRDVLGIIADATQVRFTPSVDKTFSLSLARVVDGQARRWR